MASISSHWKIRELSDQTPEFQVVGGLDKTLVLETKNATVMRQLIEDLQKFGMTAGEAAKSMQAMTQAMSDVSIISISNT